MIRRAGMEDRETVCEEACRLGEASATAATWSAAAYRTYVTRETEAEDEQKKALFLAFVQAETVESAVLSEESARVAWGRVVGFAAFSAMPDIGECSLENMAVAKEWRNHGIGTRLLSAGLLWCRAHSCSNMWLEVRASNLNAIRLYERAGFSRIGSRPDYYRDPVEAATQMKRALASPEEPC